MVFSHRNRVIVENVLFGILFFLSLLIQTEQWFRSIFGDYLPIAVLVIFSLYVGIEVFSRIRGTSEVEEIHLEVRENSESLKKIRETVERTDKQIDDRLPKKEGGYEKTNLLVDLINQNLISIKSVDETIADKKFITVFCTSEGFSQNISTHIRNMKGKPEQKNFKINYSDIFKKIGFVQLKGKQGYFIIAEDNVYPEKMRNLNKLSDYLLDKARLLLNEKWTLIMNDAKQYSHKFYNNRVKKGNPLNFNMLLIKSNRRDMRHRFIRANDFAQDFTKELASLSDISKIKSKIKEDERIEIRKFVLKSSINILILKIPKGDRNRILNLESIFTKPENEGGLGIKNFYDYHKKDKEDIVKILKKRITEDKVNEYADMIINNSRRYKDDLIKLGIDLDIS